MKLTDKQHDYAIILKRQFCAELEAVTQYPELHHYLAGQLIAPLEISSKEDFDKVVMLMSTPNHAQLNYLVDGGHLRALALFFGIAPIVDMMWQIKSEQQAKGIKDIQAILDEVSASQELRVGDTWVALTHNNSVIHTETLEEWDQLKSQHAAIKAGEPLTVLEVKSPRLVIVKNEVTGYKHQIDGMFMTDPAPWRRYFRTR